MEHINILEKHFGHNLMFFSAACKLKLKQYDAALEDCDEVSL